MCLSSFLHHSPFSLRGSSTPRNSPTNPTLKFSWMDQQGPIQGEEGRVLVKDSMYEVRCRLTAPLAASGQKAPTHIASQGQGRGYARSLTVSKSINRASETARNAHNTAQSKASEPTPKPLTRQELTAIYMADVEAELLRWEQYEWAGNDTMGTVNLVEFWKAHRNVFPLIYQITMNVLPVRASSVSSEFSSSKLTCTRERNNISPEHMEYLQVLKHLLHCRKANHDNNQTLDFMAHIVDPDGEELAE
ncbi:hAT family dimerization protein, partial [Rhizoctonia solani AG-3 Rhs1AP]